MKEPQQPQIKCFPEFWHVTSYHEGKEVHSIFKGKQDQAAFAHKSWFNLTDEETHVHEMSKFEAKQMSFLPTLINDNGIIREFKYMGIGFNKPDNEITEKQEDE